MAMYRSIVMATKFVMEAYMKMDATMIRCSRLQWKTKLQKNDAGKLHETKRKSATARESTNQLGTVKSRRLVMINKSVKPFPIRDSKLKIQPTTQYHDAMRRNNTERLVLLAVAVCNSMFQPG